MKQTDLMARALNELSAATWFGGSLMGAVGLEQAAAAAKEHRQEAESTGWKAWQPIQTAAVAAQLASGVMLLIGNRGRVAGQRGVLTTSTIKTAATGAALVATLMAAKSGAEVARAEHNGDDEHADQARHRNRMWQWAVPALTGGIVVLDALMGEQQRPQEVSKGMLHRVLPDRVLEMVA